MVAERATPPREALVRAVVRRDARAVLEALAAGAKPNRRVRVPHGLLYPHHNAAARARLEWTSALDVAVEGGSLPIVRLLFREAGTTTRLSTGTDAVQLACMRGHLPLVRYLIEERGARVDTRCLESAIHGDRVDVVRYLLARGVPAGVRMGHRQRYRNALDCARRLKKRRCTRLLRGVVSEGAIPARRSVPRPVVEGLLVAFVATLGQAAARGYDGSAEPAAVARHSKSVWRRRGRALLRELAEKHEVEVTDDLLRDAEDALRAALAKEVSSRRERRRSTR